MLYLFHGTNTDKTRQRAHALMDSLLAKKKDASLFILNNETFNEEQLKELLGSQGLFEQKYIIFLNQLFDDSAIKKIIVDYIDEMSESQHVFIMLEGKIDKKNLTKLEKKAAKVVSIELGEKDKKRKFATDNGVFSLGDFNIFNIADAFAAKDKKKLWVLLQESKAHNIPPEEVHGILMWSVRSMLLAESSKTADESGLKPFVFSKSKRNAKNFKEGELLEKSSKLLSIYHDSRRGKIDFDIALEMFVLK